MTSHRTLLGVVVAASLAPLATAQQRFSDVTAAAGIQHVQSVDAIAQLSEITAMSGGAAVGDIDGDGWVDLFVTRLEQPSILYRNLGRDSSGAHQGFVDDTDYVFFGKRPGLRGNGVAFGDIAGDGDLDLYVATVWTRRYQLFINENGRFRNDAARRGASLETTYVHHGYSPSFGDYDGDGYLDIYVTEWGHFAPHASDSRLLRNLGAVNPGHFEDTTDAAEVALEGSNGVFAFTPIFSDLDDDGHQDLALANDFGLSRLFWNDGDGTFTEGTITAGVGTDENGMGATVADFNGDGLLDWFVTAIYGLNCPVGCGWGISGNRMYLNNGDRTFTDATDAMGVRDGGWGWGTVAFDYDLDGDVDLAMTNGVDFSWWDADDDFNADPMKLWRNDGQSFTEVSTSLGLTDTGSGKGMLTFDYDRDGDLDIFMVNNAAAPVLYRNEGGSGHWLQVRLQSDSPNRFGIGARVLVTRNAGDAPQLREVTASSTFLAQSEVMAHFGLGDSDAAIHQVEVRWPSGQVSILRDVEVDQHLYVQEP